MRPRFSLRQLLALVGFVAVGFGALMASWPWMASAIYTLTVGILAFAVLAAVGKTGRAKFFWIGFAVVGWGYLWLAENEGDVAYPVNDRLVTTKLLYLLWDARYPEATHTRLGAGLFAVPSETDDLISEARSLQRKIAGAAAPLSPAANASLTPPDYAELLPGFFHIGHALFALLFAYLGGCLTRAFYDRRGEAPEGR